MLREMAEPSRRCPPRPRSLVLEDLHWSDYSTLDLLGMLGRRQEPRACSWSGAIARWTVIVAAHPLRALIQSCGVGASARNIALPFLRERMSLRIWRSASAGHAFQPDARARLHQRTDGNPLFMVRGGGRAGCAARAGGGGYGRWRLRRPLEEIARERTGEPPPPDREADRALDRRRNACSRRRVFLGVSSRGVGRGRPRQGLRLAVEDCCDELARQGSSWPRQSCSTADGTQAARYRFNPQLFPSVLTERVSAARRLRFAQRIGEWLEQAYGAHAGVIETRMAHHFEEAATTARAIETCGGAPPRT